MNMHVLRSNAWFGFVDWLLLSQISVPLLFGGGCTTCAPQRMGNQMPLQESRKLRLDRVWTGREKGVGES